MALELSGSIPLHCLCPHMGVSSQVFPRQASKSPAEGCRGWAPMLSSGLEPRLTALQAAGLSGAGAVFSSRRLARDPLSTIRLPEAPNRPSCPPPSATPTLVQGSARGRLRLSPADSAKQKERSPPVGHKGQGGWEAAAWGMGRISASQTRRYPDPTARTGGPGQETESHLGKWVKERLSTL